MNSENGDDELAVRSLSRTSDISSCPELRLVGKVARKLTVPSPVVHGGNRKRSVGAGRQFAAVLENRRGSR